MAAIASKQLAALSRHRSFRLAAVTWEHLPALSEPNKQVLRDAGLLPATALLLVEHLGYAQAGDLEVRLVHGAGGERCAAWVLLGTC